MANCISHSSLHFEFVVVTNSQNVAAFLTIIFCAVAIFVLSPQAQELTLCDIICPERLREAAGKPLQA